MSTSESRTKVATFVMIVLTLVTVVQSYSQTTTRIVIESNRPQGVWENGSIREESYDTTTIWLSEQKFRVEETLFDNHVLGDGDSGDVYFVWPKFEIYQLFDRGGKWRPQRASGEAAQDLMAGLTALTPDQKWTIAATDDTMTVNNISCHRFEFTNQDLYGTHISDVWISDLENPLVPDFQRAYYNSAFMLTGHETLEEGMKKVHGFPMLEISRGTNRKTSRIIVIDTVTVDSAFFSVPADYEEYKL
ncbi:MAG: hypothetical protein WBP29_12785 [Candidatus Zixiibacteriota bacterium]